MSWRLGGRMAADPCVIKAKRKFLAYLREAEALHWQEFDRPLPLYQPTSGACVQRVFERLLRSPFRGEEYVVELVHLSILAQCLGNANHRTTAMFVVQMLEHAGLRVPHGSRDEVREYTDSWHAASKELLSEHDQRRAFDESYRPDWKARHRAAAREWVRRAVGPGQSSVLMNVGPHSLKNFLSCSVKEGPGSRGG